MTFLIIPHRSGPTQTRICVRTAHFTQSEGPRRHGGRRGGDSAENSADGGRGNQLMADGGEATKGL